jgi:hypothetical protein
MALTRGGRAGAYQTNKIPRIEVELGKLLKVLELEVTTQKVAVLENRAAQGIDALPAGSTSYIARYLNNLTYDPDKVIKNDTDFTGASGTNTKFKLLEGDYRIQIIFGGGYRNVGTSILSSRFKLYNVTKSEYVENIQSLNINGANVGGDPEIIYASADGAFSVEGSGLHTFEVHQRDTAAGMSLGQALNYSGEEEIYGRVILTKIEKTKVKDLIKEQDI